jgi:TonB family protein
MAFDLLDGHSRRAALALALSLSFAPLLSSDAAAPSPSRARRQEAKPSADADPFVRVKRMLDAGDAAGAASLAKLAAEVRKTDAEAWRLYGVTLSRAGRHKDARKAFEKALTLRPDDAQSRAGLAYALAGLGKPRGAEREASRALSNNPNSADAHYVLAVLRFGEEKFGDAAAEAEKAFALNPDFLAAAYLYADSLANAYMDDGVRYWEANPLPQGAGKEEREAAYAKRNAATAPFRARMLALADRLEAVVASKPGLQGAADIRDQVETLRFYGGASSSAGVLRNNEVTTKAVITSKPEPGFTQEAREHDTTGTVRLRAVLGADGRVTHVVPLKRLPHGLTEKCVEAARRIRFTPATKDGRPVSQWVTLEYNFLIYAR